MNKGIYKITYDFNGMPTCVWFNNGSITDYVYTADGVKLKTIHRTAVSGTTVSGSTPTLSEQNTLYKDSTLYVGALEVVHAAKENYYFSKGFMEIICGYLTAYNYFATDHLGNVRHVARSVPSGKSSIVQTTNYYPFGGLLNEGDNHLDVQSKLYNGKELDRLQGLNLYDYGARQYDPTIGQFTSMDPLCEADYHVSPYSYCGGDPVNRIDKDGRIWNFVIGAAVGAATDYACQGTLVSIKLTSCPPHPKGRTFAAIGGVGGQIKRIGHGKSKISVIAHIWNPCFHAGCFEGGTNWLHVLYDGAA